MSDLTAALTLASLTWRFPVTQRMVSRAAPQVNSSKNALYCFRVIEPASVSIAKHEKQFTERDVKKRHRNYSNESCVMLDTK
jgi:hypothetical protein